MSQVLMSYCSSQRLPFMTGVVVSASLPAKRISHLRLTIAGTEHTRPELRGT
jgi:hypothetical protein